MDRIVHDHKTVKVPGLSLGKVRESGPVVEQLKLLIVEDDADQRDLIRETLEDHFGKGTVVAVESRSAARRRIPTPSA